MFTDCRWRHQAVTGPPAAARAPWLSHGHGGHRGWAARPRRRARPLLAAPVPGVASFQVAVRPAAAGHAGPARGPGPPGRDRATMSDSHAGSSRAGPLVGRRQPGPRLVMVTMATVPGVTVTETVSAAHR